MNATTETRVNAPPCRTNRRVGRASSLSAPNRQDASPTHWVSWRAPFRFSACIGTMNQIGTPLPALSPQGGERVAAGRERGMVHGKRETPSAVFHAEHLLAEGRGTHQHYKASRKYFPLPTTKEWG